MLCITGQHFPGIVAVKNYDIGSPYLLSEPAGRSETEPETASAFYDLLISSVVDPAGPGGLQQAPSGRFHDVLISSAVELENTLVSSFTTTMENVLITSVMSAAEAGPFGAQHHRRGHRDHGHHHGGEATTGWDVRANSKG